MTAYLPSHRIDGVPNTDKEAPRPVKNEMVEDPDVFS